MNEIGNSCWEDYLFTFIEINLIMRIEKIYIHCLRRTVDGCEFRSYRIPMKCECLLP